MSVVKVSNVDIAITRGGIKIVENISFTIEPGEILGLVGESGSGKTTVSMALLGHTRKGAVIEAGSIEIDGHQIIGASELELRELRGGTIAYVPQDPGTALNPGLRISKQILESLEKHHPEQDHETHMARVREILTEVALPSDEDFLKRYPHQLSGGQQQRVAIAIAFACRPKVIVCDEPTTGLDVTTQSKVLATIRALCREHGVAALYVSHDLAVVSELADKVAVMYAGHIVESGNRDEIFFNSVHPYTRRLIRALPDIAGRNQILGIAGYAPMPWERPTGCAFAPRCEDAQAICSQTAPVVTDKSTSHKVSCHRHADATKIVATPRQERRAVATTDNFLLSVNNLDGFYGSRQVLFDTNIHIEPGECVALVGESGSGKTTLSRCIGGLHNDYKGEVTFFGQALGKHALERKKEQRRDIQYIFQSPYASINPRRPIGATISRQLELFYGMKGKEAENRINELLDLVSLPHAIVTSFPDQLSGGERQRVAIARALAAQPKLIVCDEITSALDVSVQASVIETLKKLQESTQVGLLFVTHNLALTRTIADRVAVMRKGTIVEYGGIDSVFNSPKAEYTGRLLQHTPSLK
jgi:peptide/nickel transport system ATP-binding protein